MDKKFKESQKQIIKLEKSHQDELSSIELKNKTNSDLAKLYESEKEQFLSQKRENSKLKG